MKMQKLALALLLATPLVSLAAPPVMVSSIAYSSATRTGGL